MSRMLAALRHLEQRSGNMADPQPSPSSPEADARLASDVNEMSVLDGTKSSRANVEFAGSGGFVIAATAPAGFVTSKFADLLPVPKSSVSQAISSDAPISNTLGKRDDANPIVEPISVIEDPYAPSGYRQIRGPDRAAWSYGPEQSPAEKQHDLASDSEVPTVAAPALIDASELFASDLLAEDADEAALPCLFESEEGEFSDPAAEHFGSQRHIIAVPESGLAIESAVVAAPTVERDSATEHVVIAESIILPDPPAVVSQPVAVAVSPPGAAAPTPAAPILDAALATSLASDEASAAQPALPATSSVDLKIAQRAANRAAARPLTPDADRIALPVSDPETSSLYNKLCGRLLATHARRDPNASTVAMFVAPVTVGGCEFSLVEIGRAAIAGLTGRLLLVAADPHTEFLPVGLGNTGLRGVADVWRGTADWNDVVRGTSDRRIDIAAWGTGDLSGVKGPLSWDGARAAYELVLVAGSSEISPVVERLAPTCDAVVIVVSLGITGQRDAVNATRRLAALGAPLAGCVVTGAPQ